MPKFKLEVIMEDSIYRVDLLKHLVAEFIGDLEINGYKVVKWAMKKKK